jgi:outer membrane biosynthesis protein TonB
LVCVFAACAALAAAAQAQRDAFVTGDPALWGRATRIVEPEFPARALAEGRTGYIDVRGRVSPLGILQDIEYSPDNPQSGVFIDPVRRAIRDWEFQPPVGRDCQPSEERVTNRIWFEIAEGKPKVSVSLVRSPAPGDPAMLQPVHREDPIYPSSMRRSNTEAVVFTRVRVNAAGEVVSVEPHAYPRRRGTSMREFQHEVIRALTQWRYPPAPESDSSRVVCYDLRFKLSD